MVTQGDVNENNIINLAESIKKLLTNSSRININLKIFNKTFDLDLYEGQLKRVVDIILQYKRNGKTKEINRITDRLYLDRMDNCEFGNYNFAVAPNGKFYICPAFYFNEPESDIGSLDEGITLIDKDIFKLHKSAYCSQCDSFQCNRCIYLNKKFTNEFNTPSSLQCKISHLERKMSLLLLEKLKAEKINVPNMINIEDIDYADPVELVIKDLDVNPYTLRNC
ncbi:MAG TPA: CXXX repeat peptide maturase [Clostridiales bacterium]|nr:CXXX repeat peptide maturase [Clostridiales bacterium]